MCQLSAPGTDIRNCLRIKKGLKTSDGKMLLRQICIHQMTMTRVNQSPLAVDFKLMKMLLRFIAAQWTVCKQKGHHSVSRSVMMHLDAVLT